MNNRLPHLPKMKIEDLIEYMKDNFKIGYYDTFEEEFTPKTAPILYKVYKTISPSAFDSVKCGINYDFTEYLAWYFTTYFNSTFFELYYMELEDGYNYTFMIYQDQYGYHLVIPDGYLPIYGIIDKGSVEECVQFVANVLTSSRRRDSNWVVFKYLPSGMYGLNMKQFMDDKWVWRWYFMSSCPMEQIPFIFKRVKSVL